MTIGEKIKVLRQGNHLTQEKLARQLGVSAQAVSKWEQNVTAPDISLLADIAACFHITTDELLGAGKYKQQSGYGSYRARLSAIYEEGGTEEDFQKAISAYNDVLLCGEAATEDYMMYGYLYNVRARRDLDMALKYYEKALENGEKRRDHYWFQTHQQISLLYSMTGQADEAVDRWKAWLEQEPENVEAYMAVIWALLYARRAEEALPYMYKAEQLAPDNPSVLIAIGDILGGFQGLERYEEAIAYWDRAILLNDDYVDGRFSKAYAYEQVGQYEKAIEEYRGICKWLGEKGYDIGVETREPEEKIRELTEKLRGAAMGRTTP